MKDLKPKYLFKRAETIDEMTEWLNGIMEKYEFYDKPHLTSDLCRCIIQVWEKV